LKRLWQVLIRELFAVFRYELERKPDAGKQQEYEKQHDPNDDQQRRPIDNGLAVNLISNVKKSQKGCWESVSNLIRAVPHFVESASRGLTLHNPDGHKLAQSEVRHWRNHSKNQRKTNPRSIPDLAGTIQRSKKPECDCGINHHKKRRDQ
jgi:hypothetical protein